MAVGKGGSISEQTPPIAHHSRHEATRQDLAVVFLQKMVMRMTRSMRNWRMIVCDARNEMDEILRVIGLK